MSMVNITYSLYNELIIYCKDKASFDDGVFKMKHDEYAKKFYGRLSHDDQGEVAYMLGLQK